MIPIGDENPTRTTPYVVYILIALNVLVYAVDRLGAAGVLGNLYNWSLVPLALVRGEPVMLEIPMRVGPYVGIRPIPYEGLSPMWLTIFSSMFMHGSLMHIGGNMLYLWIFGNNIEDALGHFKFLLFYLACGLAAAFAHVIFNLNSTIPTVGASGAIAGILGAYLYLYPHANIRTLVFIFLFVTYVEIPALLVLGMWFMLQLTGVLGTGMEVGGGVAYWAHIGGFVAGFVIIIILGGKKLTRPPRRYQSPYNEDRPYPFRPWD